MAIILCTVCEANESIMIMPSRICAQTFHCCQECFKHSAEPLEFIKSTFWPDFWGVPIWNIEEIASFLKGEYITWSEAENYIMGNI